MGDGRPILRLAHSPDPDDAFMWWPLFELDGRPSVMDTGRFRYEPVMEDIETLNQRASAADLEITAMSCARYPHVRDRYAITACGASMGDDYGPKLVGRHPWSLDDLRASDAAIAIPGTGTTAFATLNMILGPGTFASEPVPFDKVFDRIEDGSFDVGLVIHEGQLTFGRLGLHLICDVGQWWNTEEDLPLPLGINTVRRDLETIHGPGTLAEITRMLLRSVEYALEHRDASVEYAMQFGRGLSKDDADAFIELYVNRWTLDFGDIGRRAVQRFLDRCHSIGLGPDAGEIDFVAAGPVGVGDGGPS